jgi:hypothetical protein
MKINHIGCGILLMLVLGGCKKESPGTETPSPQIALIKQTIRNGNPVSIFSEYIYDSLKRLREIKETGGRDILSYRYSYSPTRVLLRLYINGSEADKGAENYTLNGSGYVQETFLPFSNIINKISEYNGVGYIRKESYFRDGVTEEYALYNYSANNRLDSIAFYANNGNIKALKAISYPEGKKNSIGNENKGLLIFGKDQRMPPKKETIFLFNQRGYEGKRLKYVEDSYEYSYDDSGRIKSSVVTHTVYDPDGNSSSIISEAYEYFYQ